MLKLKPGGVGAGQNKKHAAIQTTSIMITEPNKTHTHSSFMLKLKPGGVGAVQNKKHVVIQTTSIMIAEPNTHTYTQFSCLN